ncbi:MAG: resolvase [Verrucomicrobiales bacterium]|nr:resolvase [Verrucomicrobiales bacterium]
MKIGYARVSTQDQNNAAQIDALKAAGCEQIFQEKESGGRWDRPQLHKALEMMRKGDELVVYKLDRLSRSLRDLILLLEKLDERGAAFRSLSESIETKSAAGKMLFSVLGAFAQFERELVSERTKNGLANAKSRGASLGRPQKLSKAQREAMVEMVKTGEKTGNQIAEIFNVSNAYVSRLKRTLDLQVVAA